MPNPICPVFSLNNITRFILLMMLCFSQIALAQHKYMISGIVNDQNQKPINKSAITVLNSNAVGLTDVNGKFNINVSHKGQYILHVAAEGFATVNMAVVINDRDLNLNLSLIPDNRQLNEVIVSAQKSDENPQTIPSGITSISASQVDAYRLQNTKQLTGIVPNLYSAGPGDNRNVTSIRGISTTSYDQAVATYIDGVNQFGLDTYIAQLFDVSSIEVLRGPQGTLYGRNGMGGVINITTKKPGNTAKAFIGFDAGNYGDQHYSLGLRLPLVKNKLFFGASGLYSHFGGFYTNLYNNSKFDTQNSLTGNYYLKYLPGNWGFTLNIKHNQNHNNGAFPLAGDVATAINSPYLLNQNAVSRMVDNIFNSSFSATYNGTWFNFNSQTTYQNNRRNYQQPIDGDFSPADAISIVNDYGNDWNKVEVYTQEFKFTSPASANASFKWTAGIYSFYQKNPVKQGTHFGNDAALVGSPINNFTSINYNSSNQKGIAFYGQGTYALNNKFDLTLGIRYDYEHEYQKVKGEFQMDGKSAIITQNDTASAAAYHALSPKLSLSWHLSNQNLIYGNYARGFRTGGISQLSSDPSQPLVNYEPEFSDNFEIGSKNTFWDNCLQLNLSAFYTLVNNAQVPTLILPDAITVTKNLGKLNSKGFEIELMAIPLKGLQLQHNFGYTYARYTKLILPINGQAVNNLGNRPVFSPNVTAITALQYDYTFGTKHNITWQTRSEWLYFGDQFFDLANTINQKAHSLFNASTGLSVKKLSVVFWIRNIGNKRYIDYAYDFGASHLGNPRTYGISVKKTFDW